ncbi:MAG TPA: DUF4097 family beta strand repeat-containing protein [Gemmatimonadaceae bacterium]
MRLLYIAALLAICPTLAHAQADGPVLSARAADPTVSLKLWNTTGHLRIVGWDKDSVVVRGFVGRGNQFTMVGAGSAIKVMIENSNPSSPAASNIVVYFPRHGKVAVKAVSSDIAATDASGWFYSASGSIRLSGTVSSAEVESVSGSIDLDVTTPWLRARTGDGHLILRGAPEDADVATIGGALDIAARGIARGQFGSVSGDIRFAGTPPRGAILDFSNHSGAVDLMLPSDVSAAVMLSSVAGGIENGFTQVRPASQSPRALRLNLGLGESQLTARSFKGTIRIRPQ